MNQDKDAINYMASQLDFFLNNMQKNGGHDSQLAQSAMIQGGHSLAPVYSHSCVPIKAGPRIMTRLVFVSLSLSL